MSEERQKILSMVAQGKISIEEAELLLDALKGKPVSPAVTVSGAQDSQKKTLKYLRVVVDSKQGDNVNVRVPMALLRSGLKLSSLVPPQAYAKINEKMGEKGVDFDINQFLKSGNVEELIESLGELNVDVNAANGDVVKVFFE